MMWQIFTLSIYNTVIKNCLASHQQYASLFVANETTMHLASIVSFYNPVCSSSRSVNQCSQVRHYERISITTWIKIDRTQSLEIFTILYFFLFFLLFVVERAIIQAVEEVLVPLCLDLYSTIIYAIQK